MKGHIEEKEISAYVDRQLDASKSRLVEQHLSACPKCSARYEEMRRLTKFFQCAESLDPSPYLWSKILCQANTQPSKKSWQFIHAFWVRRPVWSAAAAILILIGTFSIQHRIQMLAWQRELNGIEKVWLTLRSENRKENNPFTLALTGDQSSKPFSVGKRSLDSNPFQSAIQR
jgi:predicted anti-sigma-YlaC factor YlaD